MNPWPQYGRLLSGRVFLVAGGPSAGSFDFRRLPPGSTVVAINDSAVKLPWADICFSADGSWVVQRRQFLIGFAGRVVLALPNGWRAPHQIRNRPRTRIIERIDAVGVSTDPNVCYSGDNSGFAALNMAVAHGARDIVLVGYDLTEPGHWFGDYPWTCRKGHADYAQWTANLEAIAPELKRRGVRVRNANRESAVRCFEWYE